MKLSSSSNKYLVRVDSLTVIRDGKERYKFKVKKEKSIFYHGLPKLSGMPEKRNRFLLTDFEYNGIYDFY